jgi:tRNA pseudouridine55 synthase
VIVAGIGAGTRRHTYLTGLDTDYTAPTRLGAATTTDDAEGELTEAAPPGAVAELSEERIAAAVGALTGEIDQIPSTVSAIKVAGRRAYALVRAGREVKLAPRRVTVARFEIDALRPVWTAPVADAAGGATDLGGEPGERGGAGSGEIESGGAAVGGAGGALSRCGGAGPPGSAEHLSRERTAGPPMAFLDLDVRVSVSSGTYVRALARDLGTALGVGGHLTALRRTRVGPFAVSETTTLDNLATTWPALSLAEATARRFTTRDITDDEARALGFGQTIAAPGVGSADAVAVKSAAVLAVDGVEAAGARLAAPVGNVGSDAPSAEPVAAIGPDGRLVALLRPAREPGRWHPAVVFPR